MKTGKRFTDYYRVKLAPTAVQEAILERTLHICGDEYMRAVRERQVAWTEGRGVTQSEQSRNLTMRKHGGQSPLRDVYSTVLTDVLYQVMKGFVGKSREAKSHPPASFKYPSAVGHNIRDGTLGLSKIGRIPMAPPYPETQAKSVKIEKTAAGWFAVFAVAVPFEPHNCSVCGSPSDAECACTYCICGEPTEDGDFCSRDCAVDAVGGCHTCGTVGDCVCERTTQRVRKSREGTALLITR
jgi:hypothetical protein